ncbi:MAG: DUF418 domain-containing protein [Novosphingobium sp.]
MTDPERPRDRIATLDLIRGIAILGILAINMAGFAGPIAATVTPHWQGTASPADQAWFLAGFILFEGKMRGLLSLLFGASIVLFIESAEARGRDGDSAQLRRLLWLGAIGYVHFLLLWWGDILFTYALCGVIALLLRHLPVKAMVPAALLGFAAWHGAGMAETAPALLADLRVAAASAPPAEAAEIAQDTSAFRAAAQEEMAVERGGYPGLLDYKLGALSLFPFKAAILGVGEIVPMMLLGMALMRSGFFTGGWPAGRIWLLAVGGLVLGGAATLALAMLAKASGFAPRTMEAILAYWAALPHLFLTLAYAALIVASRGNRPSGRLAQRMSAVGRMALTNYLACSLVFTALFYGWGLGLIGTASAGQQAGLIALGWIAMLLASPRVLARFEQGPAERLWRWLAGQRIGQHSQAI